MKSIENLVLPSCHRKQTTKDKEIELVTLRSPKGIELSTILAVTEFPSFFAKEKVKQENGLASVKVSIPSSGRRKLKEKNA